MAATRDDIDRWIKCARENNFEYVISVCDTFDYEDYPVYCKDLEEIKRKYIEFDNINMQKINDIIRVPRKKEAVMNLSIHDL